MQKNQEKKQLYNGHLTEYYQQGLQIQVGNITATEENYEQLDNLVRETDCYMKDFIDNGKGEICQIHYTKITQY